MLKRVVEVVCLLAAAGGLVIALTSAVPTPTSAAPAETREIRYLSPIAVIADKAGKTLYVAEATGHQIGVVDVASGKVTKNLPLPGEARGLTLSPDGKRLVAAAGVPDGKLVIFDTNPAAGYKQIGVIDAGHSPIAPVVAPDGTVYVCDRFRGAVLAFAGKQRISIPVSREPTGLGLGDDGKTLVVANHLPAGRADQDFTASVVTLIDTATTARRLWWPTIFPPAAPTRTSPPRSSR